MNGVRFSRVYVDDPLDLPDPPENPEFNELFTDEQQTQITARFHAGITRHERALFEARARERKTYRMQAERAEKRKQAKEAYLASRFNPVLRSRP